MSVIFQQKYIEEAERQREKYLRDFDEYQKSESYKQFMKSKFEGKLICLLSIAVYHIDK